MKLRLESEWIDFTPAKASGKHSVGLYNKCWRNESMRLQFPVYDERALGDLLIKPRQHDILLGASRYIFY